uniref:Uncharacterized protein n=1 Tax=Anguilla anguilla TaxID=7936 RepID=A0A0E9TIF4_ANGAN
MTADFLYRVTQHYSSYAPTENLKNQHPVQAQETS